MLLYKTRNLLKYIICRHDGAPLLNIVQSLELCEEEPSRKILISIKIFVDGLLVFQASPVVSLTCTFCNSTELLPL